MSSNSLVPTTPPPQHCPLTASNFLPTSITTSSDGTATTVTLTNHSPRLTTIRALPTLYFASHTATTSPYAPPPPPPPPITALNVSDNDLSASITTHFTVPTFYATLTHLNLADNNLKSLLGVAALPLLTSLNVSGNGISTLADVNLHMLPLTVLRLARNNLPLRTVLEVLPTVPTLTSLTLDSNPLTLTAGHRSFVIEKLEGLVEFDGMSVTVKDRETARQVVERAGVVSSERHPTPGLPLPTSLPTSPDSRWRSDSKHRRKSNFSRWGSVFDILDTKHTGTITPRSVILALRQNPDLALTLGLSSTIQEGGTRDELMRVFGEMDIDGDRVVSREEFVEFEIRVQERLAAQNLTPPSNAPPQPALKSSTSTSVEAISATIQERGRALSLPAGTVDAANDASIDEGRSLIDALVSESQSRVRPSDFDSESTTGTSTTDSSPTPPPTKSARKQGTLDMFKAFDKHTSRFSKLAAIRIDADVNVDTPVKILLEPIEIPEPAAKPHSPAAHSPRSFSESIADQSSFLLPDTPKSLRNPDDSTASLTGALLTAHKRNKVLEDGLKKERDERLSVVDEIWRLKKQIDAQVTAASAPPPSPPPPSNGEISSLTARLDKVTASNAQLATQLHELHAESNASTAMAKAQRDILMNDVKTLSRSRNVIEGSSLGAYGIVEGADAAVPASKREEVAASLSSTLYNTLTNFGCLSDQIDKDVGKKVIVDAVLGVLQDVERLAVEFSYGEEKVKNARTRLEAMNEKLEEEDLVLKQVTAEVEKYRESKAEIEDHIREREMELHAIKRELGDNDELLKQLTHSQRTQEESFNERKTKLEREVALTEKKIELERARLDSLKSEVDGETTHLHSLRSVAQSEFDTLQRSVESLAAKAIQVKDDINVKHLAFVRVKDQVQALDKVKVEKEREHDKVVRRYDKDLERVRTAILREEEILREVREEVGKKREREEKVLEGVKFEVGKYERMGSDLREEIWEEKKLWEEKRRRWNGEIETVRKECSTKEKALEGIQDQISEGERSVEQFRREGRELSSVKEELANSRRELEECERYKAEVEGALNNDLGKMEQAINKGKEISRKLAEDEDTLAIMESTCERKKRQQSDLDREVGRLLSSEVRLKKEIEEAENYLTRAKNRADEEEERTRKFNDELVHIKGEAGDLGRRNESLRNEVDALGSSNRTVKEGIDLLKQQESELMLRKDGLFREVEGAKGERARLEAEVKGLEKTREVAVGLEKGLQSNLKFLKEEVAKTLEEKKSIAMRVEESSGEMEKKELELREMERLVGLAQAKKLEIDRVRVKWESDVKEMRMLERELGGLKSSRDLAAGEAIRCEEQAVYAREQLRELESRIVRAKGSQGGGESRAQGGGDGGDIIVSPGQRVNVVGGKLDIDEVLRSEKGAQGGSLRALKERIDGVGERSRMKK